MIKIDPGKFVNPIVKRSTAADNRLQPSFRRPGIFRCFLAMLIVFLAFPLASFAASTLEDSSREFAQKIAAAISTKDGVSVIIRNASSIGVGDAARVERAIQMELVAHGIHVEDGSAAGTRIVITLSENLSGFLWTAEIHDGAATRDVLLAVPRESLDSKPLAATPSILHAEKFWEGPERVLDAAQFALPSGGQTLALLTPTELSMTTPTAHANIELPLDTARVNLRTLTGRIYRFDSQLTIQLGPNTCTVFLDTAAIQECHSVVPPEEPALIPNHGDQSALIRGACGRAMQVLATGTGDYSQPDTIQAFDGQGSTPAQLSNELEFPGPVIALHEFVDSPTTTIITAIVRNTRSGNYEAYHLSISCSQ